MTKSNRKRNQKSDYRFLFFRIVIGNPNYRLLILSNRPTSSSSEGHSLCTAPMRSRSRSLAPIHSFSLKRYKNAHISCHPSCQASNKHSRRQPPGQQGCRVCTSWLGLKRGRGCWGATTFRRWSGSRQSNGASIVGDTACFFIRSEVLRS